MPRNRQRGAALILTLLVLAILVVLVVQFAFSVKVEQNVVQNTCMLTYCNKADIEWVKVLGVLLQGFG